MTWSVVLFLVTIHGSSTYNWRNWLQCVFSFFILDSTISRELFPFGGTIVSWGDNSSWSDCCLQVGNIFSSVRCFSFGRISIWTNFFCGVDWQTTSNQECIIAWWHAVAHPFLNLVCVFVLLSNIVCDFWLFLNSIYTNFRYNGLPCMEGSSDILG